MKNTANFLRILGVFAIIIIFFTVLTGCDKGDDPKPTPIPPVVPTVSVIASATPTAVAYGGKSKIVIEAQNAWTITISLNGVEVKSVSATATEFETPDLLVTTTYQVFAKNGTQTKVTDVTVTVAPIDPKLKFLLDGKWQLVKTEEMTQWSGATKYVVIKSDPCLLDNIYSFPTMTTCIVNWGTEYCSDLEKTVNTLYFGGYNPTTKILLWKNSSDPYDVLSITEDTLRIHNQISTFGDFNQKTDRIEEYKNVK